MKNRTSQIVTCAVVVLFACSNANKKTTAPDPSTQQNTTPQSTTTTATEWARCAMANPGDAAAMLKPCIEPFESSQSGMSSMKIDAMGCAVVALSGIPLTLSRVCDTATTFEAIPGAVSVSGAMLQLDSKGNKHIVYFDRLSAVWKYARSNAMGWDLQTIDFGNDVHSRVTLDFAIDSMGNPHIAYHYAGAAESQLKYATFSASKWSTFFIDTLTAHGAIRVTTDKYDRAHLLYWNETDPKLKLQAWLNGSGSNVMTIPFQGVAPLFAFTLDANARPRLAYYAQSTSGYAIYYGRYNESDEWETKPLEEVGTDLKRAPLIALDAKNGAYVGYYTANSFLKCKNIESADVASAVQSLVVSQAATIDSLAVTGEGRPYISFYDALTRTVSLAKFISQDKWAIQNIGATKTLSVDTSFKFDKFGVPHVLYKTFSTALAYAVWSGTTWSTHHIGMAHAARGSFAMAIDSTRKPNIAFVDVMSSKLQHATFDGKQLLATTIEGSSDVMFPSIGVDKNDNPHLAYYDSKTKRLMYARRDAGVWSQEIIVPSLENVAATSLVVDSKGSVHIIYSVFGEVETVSHALKVDDQWAVEEVSRTSVGDMTMRTKTLFSEATIDVNDHLHVVFSNSATANLTQVRYAKRDGQMWSTQKIEMSRSGAGVSIAVNSRGEPSVAMVRAKESATEADTLVVAKLNGDNVMFTALSDSRTGSGMTGVSLGIDNSDRFAMTASSDNSILVFR